MRRPRATSNRVRAKPSSSSAGDTAVGEPVGCLGAQLGQDARGPGDLGEEQRVLGQPPLALALDAAQALGLGGHRLAVGQHGRLVVAETPFQGEDLRQPIFETGHGAGVVVEIVDERADLGGDVRDLRVQASQALGEGLEARVEPTQVAGLPRGGGDALACGRSLLAGPLPQQRRVDGRAPAGDRLAVARRPETGLDLVGDEIQARLGAARNGEAIARGGAAIHAALLGEGTGEERPAAREGIAAAARQARDLSRFDPRFEPLAERLGGLDAEVADVAAEVRALVDDLDHDAGAVARLEDRLSQIFALERRFGDDEAAVLAHGEAMAAEAERLRGVEGERERRLAEDALLLAEVARTASILSELRAEAADRSRPPCRRRSRSSASPGRGSRSPSAAAQPVATSPPWRSVATPWPSTPAGSTRSSSGSPRMSANRPGRSPGSRRAAS